MRRIGGAGVADAGVRGQVRRPDSTAVGDDRDVAGGNGGLATARSVGRGALGAAVHRRGGRCAASRFASSTTPVRHFPTTARPLASSRCAGRGSPGPTTATSDTAKFDGGWLRTGDVGRIDPLSYVTLTDRAKDVIKSGGEWISSVDLENHLIAHPAVLEAAVVGVPDERWQERPLAAVVLEDGASATPAELREFLADKVVRWWLPERWTFVDAGAADQRRQVRQEDHPGPARRRRVRRGHQLPRADVNAPVSAHSGAFASARGEYCVHWRRLSVRRAGRPSRPRHRRARCCAAARR